MGKRAIDQDAEAFGERLVRLLSAMGHPRRGAGAYLAGRYKVSTVTANDWLNGRFKPNTTTARQIAEDHGSTFDWLYFGEGSAVRPSTGLPTTAAHAVRPDFDRMAAATRLLAKYLDNTPFDKALLFDAEMLAMAWDGVELVGDSVEASNILDFMAYMSRRMEERNGAIRPGEDRSARQATG